MSSSSVHDPLTRAAALNKHTAFDYAAVAKHSKLVVDTRNAMKKHAGEMGERLVRA